MDFKHNFTKFNILLAGPPPPPWFNICYNFFVLMKASLNST